jgi:signal peptide peptidase-like protein 2B
MQHTFYWLVQDVMGVCFCVLILGLFHINKIMVTSTFLFLVFIYNLFHAFTSPYNFAAVDVATGGEKVDPTYCEKYPFDSDCRGSFAPLPMMLAVPWFNDFRAEFSVVGLADIILPGLLISFAARFDAAKALVRKCSQASSIRKGEINEADDAADSVGLVGANDMKQHYHFGRIFKSLFRGYFGPLMIAYGVGLTMAYIASWATSRGQPALLFLIPACLGTTLYLGWKKRELSDLWRGPKIIMRANSMVTVASKIPQEGDQTAQTAKYSSLV